MFATAVRLSKASRAPLSPKRGNKDFYKGLSYFSLSSTHINFCLTGTRQAFLPGGHRTGAPGKHVIGGKAKYRLVDEQVRVFVAPPIQDIIDSPVRLPQMFPAPSSSAHSFYTQLKPYVSLQVRLTRQEERAAIGRFRGSGGFTGRHMLRAARAAEAKGEPEVAKLEANVS